MSYECLRRKLQMNGQSPDVIRLTFVSKTRVKLRAQIVVFTCRVEASGVKQSTLRQNQDTISLWF